VSADSLLYKKIDEILWIDWDPLGVNEIEDARSEYHHYVPELFDLANSGAEIEEIADRLYKLETGQMGLYGSRERCGKVANKILGAVQNY
jgi:hypothetical protein